MKFLRLAPLVMLAAVNFATPSSAEPVDMSTITCGQLMSMKADEVSFILTWVAGYTAGTAEELSMDPDVLGKTVEDTVKYCTENAEMSVLNAVKEVSAE